MLKSFYVRAVPLAAVVVLALLAAVNQGVGQDTSSVLEQAKKNYDDFRNKAREMKMVSVMEMTTPAGPITNTTTSFNKDEKSRVETKMEMPEVGGGSMTMSDVETIVVDDGKDMWMVSTVVPKKKLSSQESSGFETEWQWWDKFPDDAKVVGSEEYGGRDCHIVEVTLRKGDTPARAWLDKDKLILVGGEGQVQGQRMRWLHSDFREVEGREFAYKTEFFMGDKLVSTMVLQSVEINTGLPDDLFDPTKLTVGDKPSMEEIRRQWDAAQEG